MQGRQPQYQDVEIPTQFQQGQIPQQQGPVPEYDRDFDQIESYGSIIKDLTEVEELLKAYELRLIGCRQNDEGKIVRDETVRARVLDPQTAKDFVEGIRSIANQNTHFTGYYTKDVENTLNHFNYTMNRWLMFQGDKIPLRHRQKMSMEAMNIIKASLHKANNALIAKWSKGSIDTREQINPGERKSGMNIMNMFRRGK